MISKGVAWLAVAVVIVSGAATALLLAAPQSSQQTDRLVVAASIFPLADIARQIGGEHAEVRLILPPGISEHADALTPQRLQELQPARAIFQVGHGLDDRLMSRVVPAIPQVRTVTVDRGIALREFGEEGADPHYWLTVPNGSAIAAIVAGTLAELDPAHATDFEKNLQAYQAELDTLEGELRATARAVPKKEFIAMHNAWSYFADHYGLEAVATYEPVEGREPSVRDLDALRRTIQEHGITAFFAEPQKASSSAVNFLQREFGLRILVLDPVGGTEETSSYMDLMRFNMNSIAAGGDIPVQ